MGFLVRLSLMLFLPAGLASAQAIGDISFDSAPASANQPVKIIIRSEGTASGCGLEVNLGDGNVRNVRADEFPVTVEHTYADSGQFSISVTGKFLVRGLRSLPACQGQKTVRLAVQGDATASRGLKLPTCPAAGVRNNCVGELTLPDGRKYAGEWQRGTANGHGVLTAPDGARYVGEFQNGEFQGQGVLTTAKGDRFVGQFQNGKGNGRGIFTSNDGTRYEGEFRDNQFHGQGAVTLPGGEKYVGEWRDGKTNGRGVFTGNAIEYVGDFRDNEFHGTGTITHANGAKHVGEFRAGKANGHGIQYNRDGSVSKSGTYKDDVLVSSHPVAMARFPFSQDQRQASAAANIKPAPVPAPVAAPAAVPAPAPAPLSAGRTAPAASGNADDRIEQGVMKFFEMALGQMANERGGSAGADARQRDLELETERRKRLEAETQLARERERIAQAERQRQESVRRPATEPEALPAAVPTSANRKALIIGNDTYKLVDRLRTAREDARAIAEGLRRVGYTVTLRLDVSEREMKSAIRNFVSQVEGGDEVAFFFAGHGVQLGNSNYLIPIDIGGENEAQIRDEAVALQRVLDDISDRKAKFTLAVIDACRDNPFKVAGRSIGSSSRGLAPTSAATGQMVVFSAGAGQKALDNLGDNDNAKNGVFTRVFLKQMFRPAPIDKIVKDTRTEVVRLAKTVGHEQVPAIYDQVVGEFFFVK